jgi:anti-sigma factor RsiW
MSVTINERTGAPMPTCQEVIDFLMAYIDGELPPEQRAAFDAHLAACPSCVNYLESYKRTIRLARAIGPSEEPPAVPESIVKAALAARKQR